MNAAVNSIPPEVLHELFFGEPKPPEFPAVRGWYHTGRRWKRETQGRANRNARRRYRAEMLWYYTMLNGPSLEDRFIAQFEAKAMQAPTTSLYDFILGTK